jgi:CheY-like chemotaxis protein
MARILVIDDQESVRSVLRRVLTIDQHQVFEAADGREAWALLDVEPLDLIITDVYMPEMDGIEFLIRLADRAPDIPVIAISGGGYASARSVLKDAGLLGAAGTLEKPFSSEQVLDAVRQALAKPPSQEP